MTIEEKARAYDEALKRADSLTEKYGGRDFAEYVFPELTESEDERIRRALLTLVRENEHNYRSFCGVLLSEMADYLEKQKVLPGFDELTPEEKPSEDLEEAAENYITPIENDEGLDYINFNGRDIKNAFIEGARWMEGRR